MPTDTDTKTTLMAGEAVLMGAQATIAEAQERAATALGRFTGLKPAQAGFAELSLAMHHAERSMNEIFKRHARQNQMPMGLTLLDYQYLRVIQRWNEEGRNDVIVRKIAAHFGLAGNSASQCIDRLLKRGLISKTAGGKQGHPLVLTENGQKALGQFATIESAVDAECAQRIQAYAALKHYGVK
ncbi:MAG: MarR family winged helix-turn-helix transcriptional regulator [Alphaproteobacteria bacterium]|nr:MarR family winged helix-turn-helix transcriptional regulator [Alphaproteobacteria bacterium]